MRKITGLKITNYDTSQFVMFDNDTISISKTQVTAILPNPVEESERKKLLYSFSVV